jgi:hypothetical protein
MCTAACLKENFPRPVQSIAAIAIASSSLLTHAPASRPSVRTVAHRPPIMFRVLKIILRRDPIAVQALGAGQPEIMFIVSLGVLRALRPGSLESGGFGFWELACTRHGMGRICRVRPRLCGQWFKFRIAHMVPSAAPADAVRLSKGKFLGATRSTGALQAAAVPGSKVMLGCWVRRGVGDTSAGRTGSGRPSLYKRAKWRFQVAGCRRHGDVRPKHPSKALIQSTHPDDWAPVHPGHRGARHLRPAKSPGISQLYVEIRKARGVCASVSPSGSDCRRRNNVTVSRCCSPQAAPLTSGQYFDLRSMLHARWRHAPSQV